MSQKVLGRSGVGDGPPYIRVIENKTEVAMVKLCIGFKGPKEGRTNFRLTRMDTEKMEGVPDNARLNELFRKRVNSSGTFRVVHRGRWFFSGSVPEGTTQKNIQPFLRAVEREISGE